MDIKVYTTPNCTWCKKLKEWLKKNKLSFQELDISENDNYLPAIIAHPTSAYLLSVVSRGAGHSSLFYFSQTICPLILFFS
ncbi:glutaredoxin family protein [Candidatus Woesearchaeota archaeon]|nr:glutaredoxin family protein [Candidatus Woesearchaeota archaeon]